MNTETIIIFVFLACVVGIMHNKIFHKKGEIQSQFLVTGLLLLVFYIVGIISGICTIINFLAKWVF